MAKTAKPLFSLGRVVATPGALEALERSEQSPEEFLRRHISGDWGELCDEDNELNDAAVNDGSRILSAYRTTTDERMWVITEAEDGDGKRAATTLLLPTEY